MLDAKRPEREIIHGCDGFCHQAHVPVWLREPEAAIAFWSVRSRTEMNVSDRFAVAGPQHQNPVINLLARGDLFQLLPDEGFGTVIGIGPRHYRGEIPDDVPVVEMTLDRRRIRERERPQDQSAGLDGRGIHDVSAGLRLISGISDTRKSNGRSG